MVPDPRILSKLSLHTYETRRRNCLVWKRQEITKWNFPVSNPNLSQASPVARREPVFSALSEGCQHRDGSSSHLVGPACRHRWLPEGTMESRTCARVW